MAERPDRYIIEDIHRPPYFTTAARTAVAIEMAEARKFETAEKRAEKSNSSLSTSSDCKSQ